MENFNKVLSFFLGLVVVIVFVIVLSNRLNLKGKFIPFQDAKTKVSPTVASANPTVSERLVVERGQEAAAPSPTVVVPSPTTVPKPTSKPEAKGAVAKNGTKKPASIPKTGSPTLVVPAALAAIAFGLHLRKSGRS